MIQINIDNAARLDDREIAALQAMLTALQSKKTARIDPSDVPDVGKESALTFIPTTKHYVDTPDPSKIFGGATQVMTPPAAPLSVTAIPAPPTVPQPPAAPSEEQSSDADAGDVDSAGLPWDARIHARNKAKKSDGTWRLKRSVDSVQESEVKAELREKVGLPAVEPINPMEAFKSAEELGMVKTITKSQIPPVPVPLPPIATSIAVPNDGTLTFPQLVPMITSGIAIGKINDAQLQAVLQSFGLATLPALISRPDLVQSVATALGLP